MLSRAIGGWMLSRAIGGWMNAIEGYRRMDECYRGR